MNNSSPSPAFFPLYFSSICSKPVNLQISHTPLCLPWNWVRSPGPPTVHVGRGPDSCGDPHWSPQVRGGQSIPLPTWDHTGPAGLVARLLKALPAQFPRAPYLPFLASAGKLCPSVPLAEPSMPIILSLSLSKKFFSSLREGDLLHPLIFL